MKKSSPLSTAIKQKFGFTMIELLVVISIIGILIAMGTAAFTTAQRAARDAKRRGDIQQMQKAFEQYYSNNNSSYAVCATMATGYLPAGLPTDPRTGAAYPCVPTGSNTGYCVCSTLLEKAGTGNSTNTSCNFTGAPPKSYFCLSNLQ